MSRIMIVVEFEVKPEHRSAFIELMKGHAQRSRGEDGCQQLHDSFDARSPLRLATAIPPISNRARDEMHRGTGTPERAGKRDAR